MPPKSILKKSSAPSTPRPKDDPDPIKDRHLATALHHANLIQQQKDIENLILDASLELLELPRTPDANPAAPSEEDATDFKRLVAKLRPKDYDDLIEERNASRLCGYALCPRPQIKLGGDARLKLIFSKHDGIKSIPKKELERWCSPECARRALYVKVQLIEESAWTNSAGRSSQIDLMKEGNAAQGLELPFRPKATFVKGAEFSGDRSVNLQPGGVSKLGGQKDQSGLLKANIVEKRVIKAVAAPSLDLDGQASIRVEGYEPKGKFAVAAEEADTDWVM